MAYLLDTNIVSDLVAYPEGRVARRLAEVGEDAIATSIIVAGELRFGALKRGARRLTARIDSVLSRLEVLPLEAPADAVYARLRAELERQGRPIGGNDLLIAAQAIALDRVLATADAGFARVSGLKRENWLR